MVLALAGAGALAGVARADQPYGPPGGQAGPPPGSTQENPIPPYVEGQAVPTQNGNYCYGGPHPAPGGGWEASTSPHLHEYAPFDLRLFTFHEGCYYFVGDPHDFGYAGETYSYYGAHPIHDSYGGGWCFMIGPHSHWWRPWSPYFTVVGSWYYWNGPYDPFFWAYWPYYSFYYRSYYPSYYAGGRFYQTWRAAPPINRVPSTGWRGGPGGGGGWRGTPQGGASAPLRYGNGGYGAGGGWRGSPVPYTSSPLRTAPSGGGWQGVPGGGFNAPSGGGFHGGGGGGWRAPSGGGFHGGGGGGWRGGGRR
jgi:hypothetical protein